MMFHRDGTEVWWSLENEEREPICFPAMAVYIYVWYYLLRP